MVNQWVLDKPLAAREYPLITRTAADKVPSADSRLDNLARRSYSSLVRVMNANDLLKPFFTCQRGSVWRVSTPGTLCSCLLFPLQATHRLTCPSDWVRSMQDSDLRSTSKHDSDLSSSHICVYARTLNAREGVRYRVINGYMRSSISG